MRRLYDVYRLILISAVLLTVFAFVLVCPVKAGPETAGQMPLCNVSLNSISTVFGYAGETFDMQGAFEDTQGAKTAVINMGKTHRLEVLSWGRDKITVRIPQGLTPGLYRVGIYCNNPPHWQGSGFTDFRVLAKKSDADRAARINQGTKDLSVYSVRTVENKAMEPAGGMHYDEARLDGRIYRYIFPLVFALVLILVIFIILKRRNRAVDYTNFSAGRSNLPVGQAQTDTTVRAKSVTKDELKPWAGFYKGVSYTVECLGERQVKGADGKTRSEEVLTVWIAADEKLSRPFEVKGSDKAAKLPDAGRAKHVMELIKAGVDYVDIGYNTNWAAAEVPASKVRMERALAEKIVEELVALKSLSK